MVAALVLLALLVASGPAAAGPASKGLSLDQYKATVSQEVYRDLLARGLDIVAAEDTFRGTVIIDLVLTPAQVRSLRAEGIRVSVRKNSRGLSARQFAALQSENGFTVWRDYDGADGIRAQMYAIARRNPQLVKLEVLGHSVQGREILALKLTQAANEIPDGTRPAVLYSSTQHAREWISTEVNRRLLNWYIDRWRANDRSIRRLLKDTELWFVLVANPDGYQYTHQSEDTRLWRKTLRDNNGNGTTEVGDGVDPNRNYPEHWNYDAEGSSGVESSETYRGPDAGSEPETQAIVGLYERIDFAFHVNYHSFGRWLLYPEGWQVGTASQDDPIYFALSGNRDNPAIGSAATNDAFVPGLSSDVLYVTNGETTDFGHVQHGTLAWTPELSEGCTNCGFVFPDNEALVQEEFERNLPFALSVARSASDPDDPQSVLGIETKPFYLKSDDTYKTGLPTANFTFDVSYGDPQEVRVLAKRALGAVTLKYRIDGGPVQSKPTTEWAGGEKYGGQTDVYYRVMRGEVTGTEPGDSVQVWFEGGGATSPSFTYQAAVESNNDVLVLAAEDYTGASPGQAPGPHYLSYYGDALAANGVGYDVYDVDARGRKAATFLGVLSHYRAVVWYTGNDVVTRELGWGPGNASRLAMDEMLHSREYVNEGGRVLLAGQNAGMQFTTALGTQLYDPTAANAQCRANPAVLARCQALFGSPSSDLVNDVLEYWYGAYFLNAGAGVGEDNITDVLGSDTPFSSLELVFNGADSAQNHGNANSFIATSGILPPDDYPQFRSWVSARYDRPGGPFEPHTGEQYAYSQIADVSYKQLTRTIDVPAGGGTLSFWTSYNTEPDWDFLFVEARHPGQNDWTTLPDLNGHTGTSTGESCPAGWHDLHPWLERYQGADCSGANAATGGEWNAASGDSHGWQEWAIDLSDYAGGQVEISISYASDWAVQGLGVFIDDVTLPDGSSTSFEGETGGWTVTGPPAGSAPNANDFVFTTAAGFPEGAAITTEDTILLGFGLEGVTGGATRAQVMDRAIDYLLRP
ncbi:MAG TPA: M14 family zinc carboxypeptidase [Gaiellaceae bacterium]|nr:M14 family zinc carboxypeptidase [Gaiellaceae bacterium]